MSSGHPSRRLLATNGFAWHIYMPYHDTCLKGNFTVLSAASSSMLLLDAVYNLCPEGRLGFKTCLFKTKTKTKTQQFKDQDQDFDVQDQDETQDLQD